MSIKIEQKTADTILQAPTTVKIGDDTYNVEKPNLATIIQASKEISKLPAMTLENGNMVFETLATAELYNGIGYIIALLIIGVNKRKYNLIEALKWKWRLKQLSSKILFTCSPTELKTLFMQLLGGLQIRDFFIFITSLNEINLLKATRGVKTTASGE